MGTEKQLSNDERWKKVQSQKKYRAENYLRVTDFAIIEAYWKCKDRIDHADAITISDLVLLKSNIDPEKVIGNLDMMCLVWLRNKIVKLRKDKALPVQKKVDNRTKVISGGIY